VPGPSRSQRAWMETQASVGTQSPPLPPRACGGGGQDCPTRGSAASGRSLSPAPRGNAPTYGASPRAASPRRGVASPQPGNKSPRAGGMRGQLGSATTSPRFPHLQPPASATAGWEGGAGPSRDTFSSEQRRPATQDVVCGRRFLSKNPPTQSPSMPHTPTAGAVAAAAAALEVVPPPWAMYPEGDLGVARWGCPPSQQQQPLPAAPSRAPPPASPMAINRGIHGACVGSAGALPRSPRSSPLAGRGLLPGAGLGANAPQAVFRHCGSSTPCGPPPATSAGMGSACQAQGAALQRDSRAPQGASYAPPSSGASQPSGSFVAAPPQQTGSFVAAGPPRPTQAPSRRGEASGPPPYACIIRRGM